MTKTLSPQRCANEITVILNSIPGYKRFPVNVGEVARELTHQKFPDDPITLVKGDSLPNFEGALVKARSGKIGWGIIYNSDISSPGRINFTLGHEFGHYMLHRLKYPDGLYCGQEDMVSWGSEHQEIEQQANEFSATLLMPFDDFRRQIDAGAKPMLADIGQCAERYKVSLTAATSRWLQYTQRRAVMVFSRAGYILWARSSRRAFESGVYIKTSGVQPVPVPESAIHKVITLNDSSSAPVTHAPGVWFKERCEETAMISDQYDFTLSLLQLGSYDISYYDSE